MVETAIKMYDIVQISRKPMDQKQEYLDQAKLLENKGLQGDKHCVGGDKQLTLMSDVAREFMTSQTPKGICFAKAKANLYLAKSIADLKTGDLISFTNSESPIVEITKTKDCFTDCPLKKHQIKCILHEEMKFGKVISSGEIAIEKGENYGSK